MIPHHVNDAKSTYWSGKMFAIGIHARHFPIVNWRCEKHKFQLMYTNIWHNDNKSLRIAILVNFFFVSNDLFDVNSYCFRLYWTNDLFYSKSSLRFIQKNNRIRNMTAAQHTNFKWLTCFSVLPKLNIQLANEIVTSESNKSALSYHRHVCSMLFLGIYFVVSRLFHTYTHSQR